MTPLSQKQSDAWHDLHDPSVREVFFGGGARSGKSILLCLHEITEAVTWAGTRGLVAREDFTALQDSTMKTFFEEAIPMLGYQSGKHFTYNGQEKLLSWANGSETMFRHLKYQPSDPNFSRIGSTAFTRVSIDEADEVDERMAGMLRARTGYKQPPHGGKMLITGNPGDYWTKTRFVYDKDNNPVRLHDDQRLILATVRDNPDPVVREQYTALLEAMDNPYDKARLLYGDWLVGPRTGKEFFWAFDTAKNVRPGIYDPTKYLHIGFDFNRSPYMTLVVFQIAKVGLKYEMQGLKEYCLEHPLNNTESVCKAFKHDIDEGDFKGHKAGVRFYGDYSGKTGRTTERDGIAHDYDVVWSVLARYLDARSDWVVPNPLHKKVSMWMNAVFAGKTDVMIYLDPKMSNTIKDFSQVKEDADGSMLKEKAIDRTTGKSYEKLGHTSQATYYISCAAFADSFDAYTS